jgi:glutamine amidotransferase
MIAIIDSGGANIASVKFAFERLGAGSVLTDDVNIILSADKVVLPGVGAAPVAMQRLATSGLIDCIRTLQQPVLGICLGMQLMFSRSAEGDTPLLGLFDANCTAFTPTSRRSVPHMGWNQLVFRQEHPLLAGVDNGAYVYFVHSYFAPVTTQTIAECAYGDDFTAIVGENNFMGCQFHPERSGTVGARILQNFLEMA